ncbi:NAD(P)-dependent alcohol dehydrogenase [Arthrobacter antioxidans]|uniref:NAD(P)-dependent alcohol dehydrogenase n=1 Tax=Arthrobacter antioxidans TaxID=2895818 RepID=UPI00200020EC|nr:NAD(P)-dependent alcohol dehydrogenase [Arthrobacter antioxidans]
MRRFPGRRATTTGTMRAVLQDVFGGPDVLHLGEVPVPDIAEDEVLVQVRAAGVDRGVWHTMTGLPYLGRLAFGLRRPKHPVPGTDLAGVVVAVGAQVTRFAVGDDVFGGGRSTFADYAAASEQSLAHKPAGLSFTQAAAVPVSAVTALKAVQDVGRVVEGQQVLILGASGGVGSYAVQLAKAAGAHVTAVCSGAKRDYVLALGADRAVDYESGDFADGREAYDVVLDIGGNPSVARLRRSLTRRGTAVIVGGEGGGRFTGGLHRQFAALALSPFVPQRLTTLLALVRADGLERLLPLIDAGAIVPSIDRTFALGEAAQALDHLASGKVRGKIVLTL